MKAQFRNKLKILILPLILVGTLLVLESSISHSQIKALEIDNQKLKIEIADSREEQIKGLSGRKSLGDNRALLFVFTEAGLHGIWMKDMRFPIDIYWLDNSYKIVHIEKNVSPNTYPKIFISPTPANFVLEANAGLTDKLKINIGDKFDPKF